MKESWLDWDAVDRPVTLVVLCCGASRYGERVTVMEGASRNAGLKELASRDGACGKFGYLVSNTGGYIHTGFHLFMQTSPVTQMAAGI